ncbi:hypothetical protein NC652_020522 [Populus alba x Populus x berolinensis]|nr:hypothetical protein NC652_020522 [Populus alba x Populus x berolinensis]
MPHHSTADPRIQLLQETHLHFTRTRFVFVIGVASSSLVNELKLLSDGHSSNLERNRRACEVAKLLPLPDLLQSIASIKADYIAQDSNSDFEVFELFDPTATGKVVGRISLSCFFCEYYANTLGFLELACDLLVLVFSIEPDV